MRNNEKGFSLIELLIVVAIILIIASIAIPNLLRAKMAANEASAVGSLRTLNTSAILYSTTYGTGFPGSLAVTGRINQLGSDFGLGGADRHSSGARHEERLHLHLYRCRSRWCRQHRQLHDYRHAHFGRHHGPAHVLHRSERRDSREHHRFRRDRQQHTDRLTGSQYGANGRESIGSRPFYFSSSGPLRADDSASNVFPSHAANAYDESQSQGLASRNIRSWRGPSRPKPASTLQWENYSRTRETCSPEPV